MNNSLKIRAITAVAAGMLTLVACEKEGPAGPKGEQGVSGIPALTQEIMDSGHIFVYWKAPGGIVLPLPIHGYTGDPAQKMVYSISAGKIIIEQQGMNTYINSPDDRFRYIIIPGGVATSARKNGLDLRNFDAVAGALIFPNERDSWLKLKQDEKAS